MEQTLTGLTMTNYGALYGTTTAGGTNQGTIFKLQPSGALETFHSFAKTDGASPYAPLVEASNGYFYGTTEAGGSSGGARSSTFHRPPRSPRGSISAARMVRNQRGHW
jgi:uncharacterized repeat protein (TIGR03803 family)